MNRRHEDRMARLRARLLAVVLALAPLVAAGAAAAQEPDARLETARTTLEKWLETQKLIAREKAGWALDQATLQDQIALVQREIETLRGRIGDAERSIGEAEQKKAELAAQSARLQTGTAALEATVVVLEARTRELLRRLPEPIRARVQPLSQRLPEAPGAGKHGLGSRFETVVGLLNEVDKFQREITQASEVRQLADGTSAEVTAIYVGLGQAWYVGANGRVAGVGSATADGWVWTPADDAAPAIAEAIAILRNEKVARFVPLPFRIQ
jgi:chromosome segregation ATPase